MELRFGFCTIFSAFTPFFHVPEVFLSRLSRLPQAPGLVSGLPVRRSLPHVFGLAFGLPVRLSLSHAFELAFGLPGPPVSLSLSLSLSVSLETQRTLASLRVAPSTARWPLSLSLSLSLSLLSGLSPPLVSSADGAPQGVQGSPESTPPPNDGPSVVSPRSWAPWWS